MTTTNKASKSDVNYSRGHKDSHCGGPSFKGDTGYCRYFSGKPGAEIGQCERVAGMIGKIMWCKLYAKANTL